MSQLFNTNNPGIGDTGGVTLEEGVLLSQLASLTLSEGDILYVNSSGDIVNLGAGIDGYVLTLASGIPTWAAGGGGGGYTNLTEFVDQTAWRLFYSNTDGDVVELALGADGTYLKSNGATSAPSFATPTGTGVVETIVAGTGISVDSTDPANPIVTATGSGGVSEELVIAYAVSL